MACHSYPSADSPAFRSNNCNAKVAILDRHGTIVSVNQAWQSFAIANGYDTPGRGVGINYLTLCDNDHGPDANYAKQAADSLRGVLAGELASVTFEYPCAPPDDVHWALFTASPLPQQWPPGIVVSHIDILPIKDWGQSLRQSEVRFRAQIDAMPTLIAYIDKAQRYQFTNQAYETWFDVPNSELHGRMIADVIGESAYRRVRPHIDTCFQGQTVEYETALRLKDGREVFVRATYAPDPDRNGQAKGLFSMVQDISRERTFTARAEYHATHDALTGLPNRFLFLQCLKQALGDHLEAKGAGALMIIDLDNFKDVNDTFGHPFGDKLLSAVAKRLAECVPKDGTLARLSGDEFALIQIGSADQAGIQALAKQIIDMIEAPYLIDDHEAHIGVSIGVALFTKDSTETSLLMKNADLALYRAKKRVAVAVSSMSMTCEMSWYTNGRWRAASAVRSKGKSSLCVTSRKLT